MNTAVNRDAPRARLTFVLRSTIVVMSVGYLALYAVLVCLRVRYPFELEWLEGACVDHVRVILAGRPLYARPSLEFIPLTYTPAYFYLAAGLSRIVGVGFLPLRLISIAASFGVLAIMYRLVVRETQDVVAGLMASGLFAAMFGWTGGWFDIARNDSLFLFLTLWGAYLLRWHRSSRGAVAAGLVISASFLTKQTGLIVAVPLLVYCATRSWRICLAFGATVAAIVTGTTMWLNRIYDGWYWYYIFSVPRHHPVALQSWLGFWRYDLLQPLPIAVVVSVTYLAWRISRPDRSRIVFYVLLSAGLVAGAWISRLHSLSFINVVLPAYAAAALVFSIAVGSRLERESWAPAESERRRLAVSVMYAMCVAQLFRVAYLPKSFVPTDADVRAGQQLLARIRQTTGPVFLPYHGYLPSLAGHATQAHAVVIADVIRGGTTDVERQLDRDLDDALRTHRYEWIEGPIQPTPVRRWLPLDRYYSPAEVIPAVESRFWLPAVGYVPR